MRIGQWGFALLCLLASAPSAAAATRGLDLGFYDPTFSTPDSTQRAAWLDDARASGAGIVRIGIVWTNVAPSRPGNEGDPLDPAYRWGSSDAAVQDATARGLRILLSINRAPPWAEGPRRLRGAGPGTWKPNPRALAAFVQAAARRYPGVSRWQIWNEPNLDIYLTPQWTRRNRPAAPAHYRRMLNAAYSALKAINPKNVIVTAGSAPYGDPPGQTRIHPVTFWRELLRRRTTFDGFAHHPYSVGGPRRHALDALDVSVPDLGRLTRVVRTAVRRGLAVPRRRKPLWITEISWDSNPPDPAGVPAERYAAWVADTFYVLWKQGAETVLWFLVRDEASTTNGFSDSYQTGIYLRSGEPKLALQAFTFPVACERLSNGRIRVWGKAPLRGRVELQRGGGRGYVFLRRLTVGASRVFRVDVPSRAGLVRARSGDQTSLSCRPH